jgi:hypothetical protein
LNQAIHFCPEVGLFSKLMYIKYGSIEIPLCDPELIVSKINQYIDSYEGLSCIKYDSHKKRWEIEYGTNGLARILKALNWESEYQFKLGDKFDNMEESIETYKSNRLIEKKIGAKKWWALSTTLKAQ